MREEASASLFGGRKASHSHAAEWLQAILKSISGNATLFGTRSDVRFEKFGNWIACICGFEIALVAPGEEDLNRFRWLHAGLELGRFCKAENEAEFVFCA
jgi:hypothetical protein